MKYTPEEVIQFVQEENVRFIRLAFCNVYGKQHNVSIMPSELKRAFAYGIAFDASAVDGFGGEIRSDLLLHPDPSTLIQLPWRPEQGKVMQMFCDISYPDGRAFERDTRSLLKRAVADASARGFQFAFGAEMEFYLFRLDECGEPTRIPYDHAGYMDIVPDDKGETIRREICLMLEQMGFSQRALTTRAVRGRTKSTFATQPPSPPPTTPSPFTRWSALRQLRTGSVPVSLLNRWRIGTETECTSTSLSNVMRSPSRCPVSSQGFWHISGT